MRDKQMACGCGCGTERKGDERSCRIVSNLLLPSNPKNRQTPEKIVGKFRLTEEEESRNRDQQDEG